jgi:hypothetical protein
MQSKQCNYQIINDKDNDLSVQGLNVPNPNHLEKVGKKTYKIVARAGGGKSTQIEKLYNHYHAKGKRPLVVSFTRSGASAAYAHTIHSLSSKMLEETNPINPMPTETWIQICLDYDGVSTELLDFDKVEKKINKTKMATAVNLWQKFRNSSVNDLYIYDENGLIEDIDTHKLEEMFEDHVSQNFGIFPKYHNVSRRADGIKIKKRAKKLYSSEFIDAVLQYELSRGIVGYDDFTDVIFRVYQDRLVPNADVLLIDEAQDLTILHWRLVYRWAACDRIMQIYLVGDDSQCLYGFTGSFVHGFVDFPCSNPINILPRVYRYGSNIWKNAKYFLERTGTPYVSDHIQPAEHRDSIYDISGRDEMIEMLENLTMEQQFNTAILVWTNRHASKVRNWLRELIGENFIKVMTIHEAKGSTFNYVFTSFSVPRFWKKQNPNDHTEFARIGYVGTSRAKYIQVNVHDLFRGSYNLKSLV